MLYSVLRHCLECGIQAVDSYKLVCNHLRVQDSVLYVDNFSYSLNGRFVVFGIGKAALNMVRAAVDLCSNRIDTIVCSVPEPVSDTDLCNISFLHSFKIPDTKVFGHKSVHLFYGSKNNLPNAEVLKASQLIFDISKELQENDLLLVCLTGGGSALLTLPKSTSLSCDNSFESRLSLDDLISTIKLVSQAGASICELNIVRSCLDELKAGGLAKAAYPAQVVCLILSDVMGDPVEFIASGPTYVETLDLPNIRLLEKCRTVLHRYGVFLRVPISVRNLLNVTSRDCSPQTCNVPIRVHNQIIGNNLTALESISNALKSVSSNEESLEPSFGTSSNSETDRSKSCYLIPILLTNQLTGFATDQGINLANLLSAILGYLHQMCLLNTHVNNLQMLQHQNQIHISIEKILISHGTNENTTVQRIHNQILEACTTLILQSQKGRPPSIFGICILIGGETTVVTSDNTNVDVTPLGGRCSHLALSAALEWYQKHNSTFYANEDAKKKKHLHLGLLAAATDGLDGPQAAGSGVWVCDLPSPTINSQKLFDEALKCLNENNSYSFFLKYNRKYVIPARLTNTNVMDIIIGIAGFEK